MLRENPNQTPIFQCQPGGGNPSGLEFYRVIVGCRVRARGICALPHEIQLIDDVASQMIACEPNE